VRKRAGVLESYRITGTDRLMLKVVVRSIADLDSILGQLARFGTPTTSIVLTSGSRPVKGRREELVSIRLREHTELHWFALRCF
jgi:DNA-binding Lrp family transcriptional regulator